MKIFKLNIFLLFLLSTVFGFSQETFKNEAERIKFSNKLFEDQKFIEAEPHMLSFLSNKNNSEYNFKYGVCVLFKYADKSKAIPYLKKSIKDANVDPRAFFYLGRVFHYNYLFQDALNNYNKYKSLANVKQAKSLNLEMYIQMCQNGQTLMQNLSDIIVIDKKSTALDKFNYSYDLKDIGGRILPTQEFQSKIDQKRNHKPIIYFPSVKDLLFYSSYGEDGENGLDIYYRKWLNNGGWSEPKKLPENINSPFDEDFPFLNSDGTTFYFSSKGHNSMGGYDIFRCNFDPTTNDFGPINNLDYKINSTDDDILYLVDKLNENAIFSSKRSSAGGKIDVYNVKVKVLPLQNIIIAGTFKNSIIEDDIKANIKIQDIRTNKLIATYTVSDDGTYNVLLPNSGKYKFIVETPKSEKIHAGLVDAPPQDKLRALKQEIELLNKNGEEKLVIKDYFDQSPENEAVIIANLLKKMSEPEVNIDLYPDSILEQLVANEISAESETNELIINQETNLNESDITNEETTDFESNKKNLIELKKQALEKIKQQNILVANIAKLKTEESQEYAEKADDIILDLEYEDNDSIVEEQLKKAAQFNLKSKILNEEANNSILLTKTLENNIKTKEEQITLLNNLNSEEDLKSDLENEKVIVIQQELNNPVFKEPSTLQTIRESSKLKEKEAEEHLAVAQNLRSDQESITFQIEKEKEILNNTKKKKIINEQNLKIEDLKRKKDRLEVDIEREFKIYEEIELERKDLVNEADDLEKIQLSKKYNNLVLETDIDVEDLDETNKTVKSELIEKNNPQLEKIYVEIAEDNDQLNTSSTNNISSSSESIITTKSNNVSNSDSTLKNTINSDEQNNITEPIVELELTPEISNEENKSLSTENNGENLNVSTENSPASEKSDVLIDEETIAFVENLPISVPIVKDYQEVPPTVVDGVVFDSKSDPKSYQVTAAVDEDVKLNQSRYENETNNKIIDINQKNIDKINVIASQKEQLELLKLDVNNDNKNSKIDKKILKLEKKKAKAQLKIADDFAFINENEIKHLNNEISSSKKETTDIDSESFKMKQANEFENAAAVLTTKAQSIRNAAAQENNKIKKGKLLDEAIQNENTAINYLKKSKKLYAEAIIQDFSTDKLSVIKSLNPSETKQSVKMEILADIAMEESKKYIDKSVKLKEEGKVLEAKEYENLAKIQKSKSANYKEKSLDFKRMETAIVEEIKLSKSLVDAEVLTIASKDEFKTYYESEININELEKENQKLNIKNKSYLKIYDQLNAKSESLIQDSKKETDPFKKKQLLKESKKLSIESKKIKSISDAVAYSIDSVKRAIKNKENDQALVLEFLEDSIEIAQIKALAISGKADSVLAIVENEFENEIVSNVSLSDSIITNQEETIEEVEDPQIVEVSKIELIQPEVMKPLAIEDVFSKDFVAPSDIKESIFIRTDQQIYSKENPIPLNPKSPNGLVFKVQVGAFRKAISQKLFKGFAPISAEKVRDDITRYRVGYFSTYENANKAKTQVRALSNSYRDAFVVALNNGKKISLSQARTIQVNDLNNGNTKADLSNDEKLNKSNSVKNNQILNLKKQIANNPTLASAKTIDQVKGLIYSVQIGAFSKPLTKENSLNVSPLIVSAVNNLYKYSVGEFQNIEQAASKKLELINSGVLNDPFIIAYNNARSISLIQANSVNPNRVVEYKNPIIYYIDFGTYVNDFPEILNPGNLELRDFNIKSRSRFSGKQFFSKKFTSLSEAQTAINRTPSSLSNSKIIKSSRDDFRFNYEYKIEVGVFDNINNELQNRFNNLSKLEINKAVVNGGNTYYTKSRDNYDSATTDLNACKTQGFTEAKIIVFKDGVKTTLEQTQKSFQ